MIKTYFIDFGLKYKVWYKITKVDIFKKKFKILKFERLEN